MQHRSTDLWINAYLQIFSALYALQKYFDISHHDLHWGNVLVHEIPAGGFWRYTIDGKVYDVPNLGFLFTLWDFGYARIPGKVDITKWNWYYEEDSQKPRLLIDYKRISGVPLWRHDSNIYPVPLTPDLREFINNVTLMFQQGAPLQSLITTWEEVYTYDITHDQEIVGEYSFEKKLQMDKSLYQFVRSETRLALMVPTRKQAEAQVRLQNILQYDVNMVARTNMAAFMKHLKQSRPSFEYVPDKLYKRGDLIVDLGNVFIAKKDDPGQNDWNFMGLAHEYDFGPEGDRIAAQVEAALPPVPDVPLVEQQHVQQYYQEQRYYAAGEIVTFNGYIWIAKVDGADPSRTEDWDLLGPAEEQSFLNYPLVGEDVHLPTFGDISFLQDLQEFLPPQLNEVVSARLQHGEPIPPDLQMEVSHYIPPDLQMELFQFLQNL